MGLGLRPYDPENFLMCCPFYSFSFRNYENLRNNIGLGPPEWDLTHVISKLFNVFNGHNMGPGPLERDLTHVISTIFNVFRVFS